MARRKVMVMFNFNKEWSQKIKKSVVTQNLLSADDNKIMQWQPDVSDNATVLSRIRVWFKLVSQPLCIMLC